MKRRIGIVVGMVLLLPLALWAQDVKRDWDKTYDFSKWKTFAIKIGTSWNNQLSENRVLTEISEALTGKGWKKVASESEADMLAVLHGATEVKHTLNTFYSGWGGYGYGGWGGASMSSGTTTVSDYLVGTLVVDLFDAKTKKLTFRGTATDELSDKVEKNQKKLEKASDKLFKDFPVPDKKK
jgi:Domain of unknown function (DUF4136)